MPLNRNPEYLEQMEVFTMNPTNYATENNRKLIDIRALFSYVYRI